MVCIHVCPHGSTDPDTDAVEVDLGDTFTEWSDVLAVALARGAGIEPPSVGRLWVRYANGEMEERASDVGRWRALRSLEDGDIVMIEPPLAGPVPHEGCNDSDGVGRVASPPSLPQAREPAVSGGASMPPPGLPRTSEIPLPDEERNFYRLSSLLLMGRSEVRRAIQEIVKLRWNQTYPETPWDDDAVVRHRWIKRHRDSTTTEEVRDVRRMGLLVLEGEWADVTDDSGNLVTATRVGGSDRVDVGPHTNLVKAKIESGQRVFRLVRRGYDDGTQLVVARTGKMGVAASKKKADPAQGMLFGGFPPNPSDDDMSGLVLQEPASTVRQPGFAADPIMEEALLTGDGVSSFDITIALKVLFDDTSHRLLAPPEDFHGLRAVLVRIREDRNRKIGHPEGTLSDEGLAEACDNARALASACVDNGLFNEQWKADLELAIAYAEKEQYTVLDRKIVCRNLADFVEQSKVRAKMLTHDQAQLCHQLTRHIDRGDGLRLLVQAPSGSGKTLLCVKVASTILHDRLTMHSTAYFSDLGGRSGNDSCNVLLLCHSVALAQHMVAELVADLQQRTGLPIEQEPMLEGGLEPGHGTAVFVTGCLDTQVHVMTVDGFVDLARAGGPGRDDGGNSGGDNATLASAVAERYYGAIVDEGHIVFSNQPEDHLDGQHRCEDPAEVVALLESALIDPKTSTVVVFHDTSYQHVGANYVAPAYDTNPGRWIRSDKPLPIVRNPGPVRDASVPFFVQLQTANLEGTRGRASFVPTLEERDALLAGREVRYATSGGYRSGASVGQWQRKVRCIEVEQPTGRSGVPLLQATTCNYAATIIDELERIRKECVCSKVGSWVSTTAVLVPGVASGFDREMLEAALVEARARGLSEVVVALEEAALSARPEDSVLYFGPVENFAGLERPFVIVTGMRHPHIYFHNSVFRNKNRVDPRVYLAVTRCTVELTIVEVNVNAHAMHYAISEAWAYGGAPPLIGVAGDSTEAQRVLVESTVADGLLRLRLGVTVDLASPPPPEELETAVSLKIAQVTVDDWARTAFRWEQCKHGVRELDLSNTFGDEKDGDTLLRAMHIDKLHGTLELLILSDNQLPAVPAELGQLTALTLLYLNNNQLNSVPAELGQLTALTRLDLSNNMLTSVPAELGQLTALTLLYLNDNQLTLVPAELGQLTALTRLDLSNNHLMTVPPELGQLTALTGLNLSDNQLMLVQADLGQLTALTMLHLNNNQLTSVPAELGKLAGLTWLELNNNELTFVPVELGQLASLTQLNLSNNHLASLPGELGKLASVTQLNLSTNQLASLPGELGKLEALTQLNLSNNQLTSVPTELGQLAMLTWLDLRNNQLVSVPAELGQLTALTELDLSDNQLSSLPVEIGQLTALTWLGLRDDRLTAVPVELGQLAALKRLHMGNNQLTSLPVEVGQLTALVELDLSNNQLTSLPAEFWQLMGLTRLSLRHNRLTAVPAELGQLAALIWLDLRNNQLTSVPAELWQMTTLEELYLRDNHLTLGPVDIGQLKALRWLDMDDFHLTGSAKLGHGWIWTPASGVGSAVSRLVLDIKRNFTHEGALEVDGVLQIQAEFVRADASSQIQAR